MAEADASRRITPPPVPRPVPHLTIKPRSRWVLVDVRELWEFRDLLRSFGARDITLRYRQTALGVTWVVLQPLIASAIFAFVFGRVAKLPSDGVPYVVFAFAGLLAWNAFSSTAQQGFLVIGGQRRHGVEGVLPSDAPAAVGARLDVAGLRCLGGCTRCHDGRIRNRSVGGDPVAADLAAACPHAGHRARAERRPRSPCRTATCSTCFRSLIQFLLYRQPSGLLLDAVPPDSDRSWRSTRSLGCCEAFRWSLLDVGRLPVLAVAWSAHRRRYWRTTRRGVPGVQPPWSGTSPMSSDRSHCQSGG